MTSTQTFFRGLCRKPCIPFSIQDFMVTCYYSGWGSYHSYPARKDRIKQQHIGSLHFLLGYMWTCVWVDIFFWNNQKKLTLKKHRFRPSLDAMGGGQFNNSVGWGYLDLEDGKVWVKPITGGFCWPSNHVGIGERFLHPLRRNQYDGGGFGGGKNGKTWIFFVCPPETLKLHDSQFDFEKIDFNGKKNTEPSCYSV